MNEESVFEVPNVLELDDRNVSWSEKCPGGIDVKLIDRPLFVRLSNRLDDESGIKIDVKLHIEPKGEPLFDGLEGLYSFWVT